MSSRECAPPGRYSSTHHRLSTDRGHVVSMSFLSKHTVSHTHTRTRDTCADVYRCEVFCCSPFLSLSFARCALASRWQVQVIGAWLSPGCYRGQYLDEVPNSRSHAVMSCTQYVLGIDAEGGFALSRVVKGGRLRQMSCARGRLVPSSRPFNVCFRSVP